VTVEWQARRELDSQWETVNRLTRLYGKVIHTDNLVNTPEQKNHVQALKDKLAERLYAEHEKLYNRADALADLHVQRQAGSSEADNPSSHEEVLVAELERELELELEQ
jgi:hypothetical protein